MTPLERAARAVRDEIAYPHGDGSFVVEGGFRDDPFFQEVARAVLDAIREPSEAMLKAGVLAPNYLEDQSSRRGCSNIFAAMIDAALAEEANA